MTFGFSAFSAVIGTPSSSAQWVGHASFITPLPCVMNKCNMLRMVGPSVLAPPTSMPVEPLTARSVALSTLLGYYPPALPISALIRVGRLFEIADQTMRTALSRMLSAGDVTASEGGDQLRPRVVG